MVHHVYGAAPISGAASRLSGAAPTTGTTDGGNSVSVVGYGSDSLTPPSTANTDYFFLGTLFTSSPSCDTTSSYPTCRPSCSPNITSASPSCTSSTYSTALIASSAASGPHWVVATTTGPAVATWTITYSPQYRGTYDLTVQQFYTVGNGLRGRYYDNVWFINTPSITRVDPTINFQWGTGAITTYGVDYVSVRWDGKIRPLFSEAYTIYAYADDGVRVWIDRRLLIDSWDTCCNETSRTVTLSATTYHDIIVEYHELRGQATMELRYSSANTPKQIIPQAVLFAPTDILNSPFTNIVISSGAARPTTSTAISSAALVRAQAGQLTNFTIQTRDQYSNNLDVAGATVFNLSLQNGGDPFPNTTVTYSGANGLWNAYYSVIKTGTYLMWLSLTGTYRGVLPNFPATIIVSPGATMANTSYASGAGLTAATSGIDASFTIQARDLWNNNRDAGTDDIFVNFGGTVGHTLYVSAGSYTAWYTPTTAGSVTLKVFIAGIAINGSPFTVTVAPGGMNHGTTIAYGIGLNVATAAIPYTFYIQARDSSSNNATASTTATFSIVATLSTDATVSVSGTAVSQGLGLYLVTYTVNTAGIYSLAVAGISPSVGAIASSPFTLVVSPSVAYAPFCTASGTGIVSGVSGTLATFTVQLKDSGHNNLVTAGTAPTATFSCGSVTVTCVYSGSAGLYTCTYTPTAIGSCTLAILVGGVAIASAPYTVPITAAAASYSTSLLSGTGLTYGIAGTAASFLLTTYDAANNALTAGGNIVSISMISGTTTISASLNDNADGTYSVSYTPTVAANYTTTVSLTVVGGLNAYYYTDELFATTPLLRVEPLISFDWGNGSPLTGYPSDYFSIKFVGKIKPLYSETYTFYTALGSLDGVRLTIGGTVVINSFDPLNSATEPYGSVTLVASTYYDILLEYKEETGTAALSLYWRSASTAKQIVPSAYLYHVDAVTPTPVSTFIKPKLPTSSATTTTFVAPSSTMVAGIAVQFNIQAKDIYGNSQLYQDEASIFAVYLASSPSTTTGSVAVASSGAGGLYTASITPGVSGSWLLYVTLNGVSIAGSGQQMITVVPGVATATQSSVTGLAATTAGTATTFTITARDIIGNVLTATGTTFTVDFQVASSTIFSAIPVYQSGGTYLVTYTATAINTYSVLVRLAGVNIVNSPGSVVVSAGVAAAANTAITTPAGGIPAATTNGAVTTFTITTKDANGNSVTDTKQTFYVYFDNNQGLTYPATSVVAGAGATYVVTYALPTGPSTSNQYLYNVMVAASGVGNGLTGTYYNNRWLQTPSVLTRIDSKILFNWGTDLITPTAKDYVSVAWTGYFAPATTGAWVISVTVPTDGVRLYVNNYLRIDQWTSVTATTYSTALISLVANILVPIRLEYRANTGAASISLSYSCTDGTCTTVVPVSPVTVIPTTRLWSSASHITGSPYTVAVV